MPLQDRPKEAFADDEARAYGDKFLDILLSRLDALDQGLRRTVALIVLLAAAFILLAGAKDAQVTIGPVRLKNVAGVLTLLAALIAYLYYEFIVLARARRLHGRLLRSSLAVLQPKLHSVDLGAALASSALQAFGGESWRDLRSTAHSRISRAEEGIGIFMAIGLIFGAIAFLGYAYYRLYDLQQSDVVAVTISLAFSLLSVSRAALFLFDSGFEVGDGESAS